MLENQGFISFRQFLAHVRNKRYQNVLQGPPTETMGKSWGEDRRPKGIILFQRAYKSLLNYQGLELVLVQHCQKCSQNSANSPYSQTTCNASAPTCLPLATVQPLPANLQHAKGVLLLQKIVEHSHPSSSSGPVWAAHPALWL